MNPSGSANQPSGTNATVSIEIQSTGTLNITPGNDCTASDPDQNNPTEDWTKTTYTYPGGTFDIKVTGIQSGADLRSRSKRAVEDGEDDEQDDNTKNLDIAISDEKEGVAELYHYKNTGNNRVLKLRKNTSYYIYYYTISDNWTKLSCTSNVDDAQDSAVISELSNRVEIQLEINTTGGPYIQFDHADGNNVTVGNAQKNIAGYSGYRHDIAGGLKIEKISHKGSTVRGIGYLDTGTPISGVSNFWVLYEREITGMQYRMLLKQINLMNVNILMIHLMKPDSKV